MDLHEILVNLDGLSDQEISALARSLYREIYLTSGQYGDVEGHDGIPVRFWANRFEHAFFTSSDRIRHSSLKDKIDPERVKRIYWIQEIIAGRVAGTACWETTSPTGRKRPPNRLYVYFAENFVVWLEPTFGDAWKFSTAYSAQPRQIREYCRRGKRIWAKK